jgi:hypothetical protein
VLGLGLREGWDWLQRWQGRLGVGWPMLWEGLFTVDWLSVQHSPAPPPPLHHAFSSPPVLHIPRHSQEWGWGGRRGCRNWAWGRPRTRLPSRPVPHLHEHRRHVSFCMAAPGAACVCCNAPFQQEHSIRINSSGYGGWGGRLVSAPASTDPRAGLGKLGLPPWTSAARPRLCCPKSGT